ncbi:DEKNAAC101367 [Brettanomyces naardenensis]|uniref:DEKNAAC101367 n=1 Tax=Brettanomyces naardenensis TaxID=13370 RepID=A0A448YHJ9_BRENA|nr:DEKNAAC101367 [Brettanomyces naardenensis]
MLTSENIHGYLKTESIDFRSFFKYVSWAVDKGRKKRITSIPRNTDKDEFITLASTNIEIDSLKLPCPDGEKLLSDIPTDSDELRNAQIDISLKFTDDQRTIEAWSIFGKSSSCLFTLEISPEMMTFIEAESNFLKPRYRNKRALLVKRPHLVDLQMGLDNQILSLGFKIHYSLALRQSLNQLYSLDFIKCFHELSIFIMTADLTSYERSNDRESDRELVTKPSESSFYSLITDNTERTAYNKDRQSIMIPGVRKKLLGFQSQALDWMLRHEGVELKLETANSDEDEKPTFTVQKIDNALLSDGPVDDETLSRALDKYSFGWSRVRLNGNPNSRYWYNTYTCNFCTRDYALNTLRNAAAYGDRAQALLSEEMGLGKTVEVISLVQMNQRMEITDFDEKKIDPFSRDRYLAECKTTLIICPQTIIGQWLSEIREASDLSVMIYEGITSYENEARATRTSLRPEEVAKKLSCYDVVLVSYHTVSRELHRAIFKPTRRPKRHCAKRLKFSQGVAYDFQGRVISDDVSEDGTDSANATDEYERIDYSSPLMLLEFWRVVLDEVQMTANINANASKFARIIPRVHAWGVSGTLIKTGLDDLHSLLSFLRYSPIDRFSSTSLESPWKSIVEDGPYYMFARLFKNICMRHTKKMVADQIRLPRQNRIMLRAPFTSVERDNYDFLFNQFLSQVGLNEHGEPTVEDYDPTRSYTYMRQWLIKLRQVCCHAQLGRSIYAKRHSGSDEDDDKNVELVVGTLGEVLSELIKTTFDEFSTNDRAYYAMQLKKGKVYEFLRQPSDSLKLFEVVTPEIESKVSEFGAANIDDVGSGRLRAWQELLHQAYFLLASSHYQHYRPMDQLPDNFEDLDALDVNEPKIEIDTALLTPEEKAHYDVENEYYDKADALLMQILEDPLQKVDEYISKMLDRFEGTPEYVVSPKLLPDDLKQIMQLVDTESAKSGSKVKEVCEVTDLVHEMLATNLGFNPQTSQFYERVRKSLTQLNIQAHMINSWSTELIELLRQPVTRDQSVEKLTGEEYGDTLINQELANTYLEELQNMLEDREHAIVSVEEIPSYRRKNLSTRTRNKDDDNALEVNHSTNRELHLQLDKIRKKCMPDGSFNSRYSLKLLWLESANIEMDMKVTHDYSSEELLELVQSTSKALKEEFNLQKKNIANLRTKVFDAFNDTFNAKVNYFKALQIKSDALINYRPGNPASMHLTPVHAATEELRTLERDLDELRTKLGKGRVRLTYLKSLLPERKVNGTDQNVDTEVADRICVICRSKILVGTLTACGHQYCKECLREWTKNKPTCPVCGRTLRKSDLYTFTHTRKQLKGGLVEDSQTTVKDEDGINIESDQMADDIGRLNNTKVMEKDLFKIYKSLDDEILREIMNISLVESYGSKIDMIVRQVLFLKRHEEDVQVLVFSQWSDFLKLVGHAMAENGIRFLSSVDMPRSDVGRRGARLGVSKVMKSLRGSADIEEFKKDPQITCFLLNAKAQAAGLTLTNASHVFLCEPLVNLSLELQAISRIHRIGQTKPTTVWNFVIENTVEESIAYLSTRRRLELSREQQMKVQKAGSEEFVDEDAIGVTELSKNLDKLVDKNDGEVIANDDLWASFFASRSTEVMDSVVGIRAGGL